MKKQFTAFSIIIFLILGGFFFAGSAYAETEVSGNITSDTTWTLADSPYIATGTVQVLEGITLTIEPGVEVKFADNVGLNIEGELNAVGGANNPITFTKQSKRWNGIFFSQNASGSLFDENFNYINGSIIKFSKIEYAGTSQKFAIQSDISIYLDNNIIKNNSIGGIYMQTASSSKCVITNNTINYNDAGILVSGCKKGLISNNNFDFNSAGLIIHSNTEINIENNSIKNTKYYNYSGWLVGSGDISTYGILIDARSGNILISNNNIENNYTGIWIEPFSKSINKINKNNIINNTYGIYSRNFGDTSLIDNNNLNNSKYNLYFEHVDGNRSTSNLVIAAEYNYWGSVDESIINSKIYDYYDDILLGKVNYEPYALVKLKFDGTDTFSQPPICTSWVYSTWSQCSNNGQQARSIISSSPNGCADGSPVLTQSCTYVPPVCTSWTYSDWGACVDTQQTRTIASSQPVNCAGGDPTLNRGCNSTPLCTGDNWTSALTPISCPNSGQQIKKWTKIGQCQGGISRPSEETVSCDYQIPTCTNFTYSDWSICSSSGVQSRTTLSASPSGCTGGNSVLSKSCNYIQPCISDTWSCGDWSDCLANGSQTRICTKIFNCLDVQTESPITNQDCKIPNQNSQNEPQANQIQNESTPIKNNEQEISQEKNITGSQVAKQRRSEVASAVQEILQVAERDSGVGQQVKIIAQTQVQNQEKLEISLQKVQNRSGLTKFFVGPNYEEINNAEKLLEQNRKQIEQFNQVKNQLVDEDDQQKLTEQIQLFEQSNQEIKNSLNTSQKGFSLLGWLFKLFKK